MKSDAAVLCVVTKVDRLDDKDQLLPLIQMINEKHAFKAIVPVSALKNEGLDILLDEVESYLPENPHVFEADEFTDRSVAFLSGELIREQVVRQLGAELPHRSTVIVDQFDESTESIAIDATICVERDSQKGIVIGKQGQRLKQIGTAARLAIQDLVGVPVVLKLHVRVRAGWTDDQQAMTQLGYR